MKTLIVTSVCLACFAAQTPIMAAQSGFFFKGDARTGYFSISRDDRDGSENDSTDEFRLRLRLGLGYKFNDSWTAKGRVAGRYSTDDRNHSHFEIFKRIPAGDGLRRGDSTIDEFYLDYHDKNRPWGIRIGRQQTKFELEGVAKKTLDRNDSPNTDITWTDGIHFDYKAQNGWHSHVILQYNDEDGPTNVRRGPLNFNDDDSRITYFVAFENKKKWGPIVQRAIDVTYLPDSLRTDGSANGDIDDYVTIVGRLAARWPLTNSGTDFMLAGELGYAPNTPKETTVRTGTSGDAGGLAGQISFNFLNVVPKHSVGLVLGAAGGGYLLSPDFGNNQRLVEARYQWKIDKKQRLEGRLRHRRDLETRTNASDKREDIDYYLRYTIKF